jgi:hypothetical protein
MTTIGSTNPYLSLYALPGKTAATAIPAAEGDSSFPAARAQAAETTPAAITVTAPKLADALWALDSGDKSGVADKNDALAAEFSEQAEMTVAERIRAQYLEDHEMSEETLASMSAEDRNSINAEITKLIEQALGLTQTRDAATPVPTATAAES